MKKELSKVYDPHEVEERIYQQWEENKCFAGVRDASSTWATPWTAPCRIF